MLGGEAETFAQYLARQYVVQRGYTPRVVPEAVELADASDVVLTRSDGLAFEIICLIDREADPGRHFELPPDRVQAIGEACLKYTGRVQANKMPVSIVIIEIGPTSSEADCVRLQPYRRRSVFAKVVPSAKIVDTTAGTVWTNIPFYQLNKGRGFILHLLRSPRASDRVVQMPVALARSHGAPVLIWGMLAVLAFVFLLEQVFGVEPSSGAMRPSVATLFALGGLNFTLVFEDGEWYRLFAAPLLHGDLIHLAMNGLALLIAGGLLERLVGRAWLLALFAIGALGGSLMSLAVNPATQVSVGASGAIMGLLAAGLVLSYRLPWGAERSQVQMGMLQMLIPSLIPLATSVTGQHIDFGAHLGGALSGGLAGVGMLTLWPRTMPRSSALGRALAAAGLAAFAWAIIATAVNYEGYAAELIPREQMPTSDAAARQRSADLVRRYPRDPRAHLFRAGVLLDAGDKGGAEAELRAALAEDRVLRVDFTPELEWRLRTFLALVLIEEGRRAEAEREAQPVCRAAAPDAMRDALAKAQLCDATDSAPRH